MDEEIKAIGKLIKEERKKETEENHKLTQMWRTLKWVK